MTSFLKPLFALLVALVGLLALAVPAEARPPGYIGELIVAIVPSGEFAALVDETFFVGVSWSPTNLFFDEQCFTNSTDWNLNGPSGSRLTDVTTHSATVEWVPNSSQIGTHMFTVRVDWTGTCNGSTATDSDGGSFTVFVTYDCDPVIQWIGSPYPNPFFRGDPQKGDFTLAIEDASGQAFGADIRVDVFNNNGQTVYSNDLGFFTASFSLSSPREHRGEVMWKGRNNSGNVVAAGIYFIRLKATPNSEFCPIVTSDTRKVTVW